METIAHPRKTPLTADEREVIVTYTDAEKVWHLYSDSATLRGTVLRLARQLGAEVHRVGDHGVEFEVPQDRLRLTARRKGHQSRTSFRAANGRTSEAKVAIVDGSLAREEVRR